MNQALYAHMNNKRKMKKKSKWEKKKQFQYSMTVISTFIEKLTWHSEIRQFVMHGILSLFTLFEVKGISLNTELKM
jgi:hypothetical protein